jgi:transcriptional regulator GlxA family with amidase domain
MMSDPLHPALHPAIDQALRRSQRVPNVDSVRSVSRQVGLSRRWLAQTFNEQIGMTPKRYCRLMRFRSIVRHVASGNEVDWAAAAVAGGYCDQAHLAHDFREFSGMTPTSYVTSERPHLNHVRIN